MLCSPTLTMHALVKYKAFILVRNVYDQSASRQLLSEKGVKSPHYGYLSVKYGLSTGYLYQKLKTGFGNPP